MHTGKKLAMVYFMGGEPSLHWREIDAILCYAQERYPDMNLMSGFTTNAVYMPDEMLEWVKAKGISMYVSMDGCREAHDITRRYSDGRSSFDIVEANIHKFRLAIPRCANSVRLTFTRQTMPFLMKSIQYLASLGFQRIATGKASMASSQSSDLYDAHDVNALYDAIDQIGDLTISYMESGMHVKIQPFYRYLSVVAKQTKGIMQCKSGISYLSIDTQGNIVPCHMFCGTTDESLICGSVAGETPTVNLDKINKFLDVNQKRSWKLGCHKCAAIQLCSNVCPFHYCYSGQDESAVWVECEHSKACVKIAKRVHEYLVKTRNEIYAKNCLES
jgi:uncharacterized protein